MGGGYFCLFCKPRGEDGAEALLKADGYEVIPAMAERMVFKKGQATIVLRRLIRGYVFFASAAEPAWPAIRRWSQVLYPLQYAEADEYDEKGRLLPTRYTHHLRGRDLEFVQWLIRQEGLIKLSTAVLEGDRIVITDGPLKGGLFKGMENRIVTINKRQQCAAIEVHIGGTVSRLWLSFMLGSREWGFGVAIGERRPNL